jgi:uroporphyrinogen-III synthase
MSAPATRLPPVVVTRAEASDGPLSAQLRSLGLEVLLWPAVEVAATNTEALDAALKKLGEFDWIVFASRNAVSAVITRVSAQPAGLKVAARCPRS